MAFSGDRFSECRHVAGLSQEQITSGDGVGRIQVSFSENGHRNPSPPRLQSLADVRGVRVDDLPDERGVASVD